MHLDDSNQSMNKHQIKIQFTNSTSRLLLKINKVIPQGFSEEHAYWYNQGLVVKHLVYKEKDWSQALPQK